MNPKTLANQTAGELQSLVAELKEQKDLDAAAVLRKYPQLARHKSIVLDLAYEEYCQHDRSLDRAEFVSRFSPYSRSLARLLEIHDYLAANPSLLQAQSDWPHPPCSLLDFEIVEELGRGAFSRVYLAYEKPLGNRAVAVKVTQGGAAEADRLGRLDHPNIVPVFSVQQLPEAERHVICMPYLGRATLQDLLDQVVESPVDPGSAFASVVSDSIVRANPDWAGRPSLAGSYNSAVLLLAIQCSEGLAFTHERGILHLDLKPSNILLTLDGHARLMDFNLSLDAATTDSVPGGTLPYMSPEQIRAAMGSTDEHVDVRSDIYSLGLIAYELLAGIHPFPCRTQGTSLSKLADGVLKGRRCSPRPLKSANPAVDPVVAEVIMHCLAFDPVDRPQSADVVAQRLRTALSRRRQAVQWLRRHRRPLQASVAAFVLAALFLIVAMLARPPLHERQLAEAVSCARQHEFDRAVALTTASLKTMPGNFEAYFLRGLAYQGLGETNTDYFGYALQDFNAAAKIREHPGLHASRGYCLNRGGFHQDAIRWYELAVASGTNDAVVRNNLGFSHLQRGNIEAAIQEFNKAIREDSSLQAAYYNRAWGELLQSQRSNRLPAAAIADLEEALRIGPTTSGLLRDLARFQAVAARFDSAMAEKSLQTLEQAVEAGLDARTLQKDSLFRTVSRRARFQELITRSTSRPAASESPRVLPPIDPASPPTLY